MAVPYRQYEPSLLEPVYPQRTRQLEDLAVELAAKTGNLTRGLHPTIVQSLGALVRSMNCYYSNLIEGHRTTPRDIERTLIQDFSSDAEQRDLQLEAKAHIEVQSLVDLDPTWQAFDVTSPEFIQQLHREFYQRLPERFWQLETMTVIPGEFRTVSVQIGRHVPPTPETLPSFLERFARVYNPEQLSKIDRILAAAASHHRLVWIHPFLDGNAGYQERQARSVLKRLLEKGLLVADSPKAPVRLGFPTVAAEQWLPRLWAD